MRKNIPFKTFMTDMFGNKNKFIISDLYEKYGQVKYHIFFLFSSSNRPLNKLGNLFWRDINKIDFDDLGIYCQPDNVSIHDIFRRIPQLNFIASRINYPALLFWDKKSGLDNAVAFYLGDLLRTEDNTKIHDRVLDLINAIVNVIKQTQEYFIDTHIDKIANYVVDMMGKLYKSEGIKYLSKGSIQHQERIMSKAFFERLFDCLDRHDYFTFFTEMDRIIYRLHYTDEEKYQNYREAYINGQYMQDSNENLKAFVQSIKPPIIIS